MGAPRTHPLSGDNMIIVFGLVLLPEVSSFFRVGKERPMTGVRKLVARSSQVAVVRGRSDGSPGLVGGVSDGRRSGSVR